MIENSCCTCAKLLLSTPPPDEEKKEKQRVSQPARELECCGRKICMDCIDSNLRFATYCPFCQVSTSGSDSSLPAQGLRDPPAYSPPTTPTAEDQPPPPYTTTLSTSPSTNNTNAKAKDVLHFIDASHDTLLSLSLRYDVPADALRRSNSLYADHLLAGRRTLIIPGEFYKGGVSLSPRPIEGEEEELRKAKIRRWMVACKVAEYELALVYLKQADYDLNRAIERFMEDERWEREHPLKSAASGMNKGKNKGKTTGSGSGRWSVGVK
ncbi:MAG: hypothetical protein M1816_003953 [Peltula sp. TS41687]|nr:MAG: hypothetical protein M1816_003953 [Peltula sp. TS41687]